MRESKMAQMIYFLLFIELILIIPSHQSPRHGFAPELLHADNELNGPKTIGAESFAPFMHGIRNKRDVKPSSTETTSKSGTSPSAATSSEKPTKNKPIISQMTGRANVTIQSTNNMTTMVSIRN